MNAGRLAATSPASRIAAGLPGGSSASAIRGMLGGNHAISNLSRVQARTMLQAGRNVPMVSASAPFASAWDDVTSIGSHLSTVFNRANLSAALAQSRGSWNAITDGSSPMAVRLAQFTGNSEALAHLDFSHGIDAAVRNGDMFTRATALTGVQFGTTGLSFGLDTYQLLGSDLWADTFASPADRLNIPGDGVLAR